jgi:uncharacterized protein
METRALRGNRLALYQPLTDSECDRLAAILSGFPGEAAMNFEEADGYLTALICGPVPILPSVYLREIWGGGDNPFATASEFEGFLYLVVRHSNYIARMLAARDQIFQPRIVADEGRTISQGNRWAQGFLRGIGLCRERWHEIFEDDEKFSALLPVLALAHENDPDPATRSWETPPGPRLRERLLAGLSVAAQWLYDYFRSRQGFEPLKPTGSGKMGRNDLCNCGSGKKYKRCCGNVTIH